MHGTIIRGDFCNVTINRYCFIDADTVIRPAYLPLPVNTATSDATAPVTGEEQHDVNQDEPNPNLKYVPMHIGKYTHIGQGCVIQAASIGLGCHIGDRCVISNRAILKDHVQVLEGSVVAADAVAPPFAILAGRLQL